MARPRQNSDDKAVLKEARARFKEAMDADQKNREQALDDLKFAWNLDNYQWPQDAVNIRRGRPMLTENRLPQFIRQVVNGQRENRPSIHVAPANDAAVGSANIIEGMIRHVEQWSKADLAYDKAFEGAVKSSLGYFRITTEYADDEGFDQEICIRPVDNPFSIYDDPFYNLPDGSDRRYSFVTEWVDVDEFEAKYGFKPTDLSESGKGDSTMGLWWDADTKKAQVAEYWRLRVETEEAKDPASGKTREVEKKIVEHFLMTGDTIIKESDWAGRYIPIIPVYGEVENIEGKKYRKSLIRDAKEPQRINNYFLSAEVEVVALQPKAPWTGPTGAFETDQQKWATSNAENHAYLQYDGEVAPQRNPPPAFPSALREVRMASIEAMKSCMGIYDASLGARSNETSGVAIEARQDQGQQSTFHYIDNMTRAIRYAGMVIIDLIPKVYDAERIVRILEPDGEAQMVAINHLVPPIDPATMKPMANYDVKAGRYDVVVKAGPSFQTQRQEIARNLTELVKAYPQLAQLAGDILIKNLDFPDADKVADRLKAAMGQHGPDPKMVGQMQNALQQLQKQVGEQDHKIKEQSLQLMGKDLDLKAAGVQLKDKGHANSNDSTEMWVKTIVELLKLRQSESQHADTMQSGMIQHRDQMASGMQQHQDKHGLSVQQHQDGVAQGQQQFSADQANQDRQFGHQVEVDSAAAEAARIKQDAAQVAAQ